jgi:hypothetical protein
MTTPYRFARKGLGGMQERRAKKDKGRRAFWLVRPLLLLLVAT